MAGYDTGDTRNAAGERIIGPGNASRLTMAWSLTAAGVVADTPTEFDGVLYFTDEGGKLWAVAGDSGRLLWSHEVTAYSGFPAISATRCPNGTLAIRYCKGLGHKIYAFRLVRN